MPAPPVAARRMPRMRRRRRYGSCFAMSARSARGWRFRPGCSVWYAANACGSPRKQAPRRRSTAGQGKGGLAWASDDGEGEALLRLRPEADLRLDVAAAFEALPPHYRDVALMRDVKEMTRAEIADALGATRQAVKARLHRARALLREYLTR